MDNVLTFQPIARETSLSHPHNARESVDEDRVLVEDCWKGDLSAFERLYLRHGGRMKSLACNLLGNASDAEDAVQESFLKIYRGIRSFQGQSSFSTWIYRILVNTCLDIRRKRRGQEIPEGEINTDRPQFAVPHRDHPLQLTLEKLVGKLDGQLRHVFLMFEVEGFKHSEIAGILDISEASSKHALFEAKKELRRLLARSQSAAREG